MCSYQNKNSYQLLFWIRKLFINKFNQSVKILKNWVENLITPEINNKFADFKEFDQSSYRCAK